MNEFGLCDPDVYTVYVRSGLVPQVEQLTFYHELVHSILFAMGKTQHDEEFVEGFAVFLHQFMETKK